MNEGRARYLLVVFGLLFLTLIGYLTYCEIEYTDKYTRYTYNPRNYKLEETVLRGSFLDCNDIELAYSEFSTDSAGNETKDIVRIYPYNDLYTGIIGYVSKGNDYSQKTQLEEKCNYDLLDTSLVDKIKDKKSRGKDVKLTLNHNIQKTAYDALGQYNGAVVAINPKTGAIYAAVSKPSQDANNIDLSREDASLLSRALNTPYPPGSTYKIVTAAAILEEGLQNEIYEDKNGKYIVPNANGGKGYGNTDLNIGFTVSSNAYFGYMSAEKLKEQKVKEIAKRFMLNENLNNSLDFELNIAKGTFQKDKMNPGDIVNSSIGQGQTAITPIHLALIGSVIANEGVMPNPYIIDSIGTQKIAHDTPGKRIISKNVSDELKTLMSYVTNGYKGYRGTGSAASMAEYNIQVCGKTGTSETGNSQKDNAVYVGFAPFDNPEIVVAVVIENVGYGGTYAAPVAKKVMKEYFELN